MKIHTNLEKLEALSEFSRELNLIEDNTPSEDKIDFILAGLALFAKLITEDLLSKQIQGPDQIS